MIRRLLNCAVVCALLGWNLVVVQAVSADAVDRIEGLYDGICPIDSGGVPLRMLTFTDIAHQIPPCDAGQVPAMFFSMGNPVNVIDPKYAQEITVDLARLLPPPVSMGDKGFVDFPNLLTIKDASGSATFELGGDGKAELKLVDPLNHVSTITAAAKLVGVPTLSELDLSGFFTGTGEFTAVIDGIIAFGLTPMDQGGAIWDNNPPIPGPKVPKVTASFVITAPPVPEPSTLVTGSLMVLALIGWVNRRRVRISWLIQGISPTR